MHEVSKGRERWFSLIGQLRAVLKQTGGWDGGTGKGREDLEKDKTKSKRNGRSGQTPIRTREALFVVLV